MSGFACSAALLRLLPLLLLLLPTMACTGWKPLPSPWPESLSSSKKAHSYRLVLTDGQRVTVDSLRIVGDSVIAFRAVEGATELHQTRYSIPMPGVPAVEREVNRTKYVGLGGLAGAVLGAAGGAAGCQSGTFSKGECAAMTTLLGALLGSVTGFLVALFASP